MRISDWSSDVCSSDLPAEVACLLGGVCRVDLVEDGELPALLLGDLAGGEHEALVVAVVVRVSRAEHTDLPGAVTVYIGLVGGHAALLPDARIAGGDRRLRRTVIAVCRASGRDRGCTSGEVS